MKNALFCLLTFLCLAGSAIGHELRPAYLELKQTGVDSYDVLWKVPARDGLRFGLYLELPEGTSNLTEPHGSFSSGGYIERWSIKRPGGLSGATIHIEGLSATVTDVLVRVERMDGSTQVTRLTSSTPSFAVEAATHPSEVARTYLILGIEHILTGVDHLLFVSGLLLLVRGFGRLVKTISAFTLSHSVTLTLATLGVVHIPTAPVEAVIALSILFVACEILRGPDQPLTLAQRKPWLIAFTFGLLHGLGFAGGLSAAGLPTGHIPLALALFSAGVEIGHFSFVALALLFIAAIRHWNFQWPDWAWRVPAYAIGATAAYWLILRFVDSDAGLLF